MKYCRFKFDGAIYYGLVESLAGKEMITRVLIEPRQPDVPLEEWRTRTWPHIALAEARLLAPVLPGKIIGVGRNYAAHARELGNDLPTEPLIFFKPPSAVIGPGDAIRRPQVSERVDHEAELGLVIGGVCRNLQEDEDVREYIRGYTCVNDITARDLQKRDGQWTRAKGFDTFCPLGPLVSDEPDPWAGLAVECRVNGELRQQGNTHDFIFPVDALVRYISSVMTLIPGDLISTGTPEGVGPLLAGDVVEVFVEGIGTLSNRVEN